MNNKADYESMNKSDEDQKRAIFPTVGKDIIVYIEQLLTSTPIDALNFKRWRNYVAGKHENNIKQKSLL